MKSESLHVKLDKGRDEMKGKRFTEEQIIKVLKLAEGGMAVKDLCRQQGITQQTFYRWRSKFGGMELNAKKT